MKTAVITGVGCICSVGQDAAETWTAASNGVSGIANADIAAQNQPELVFRGPAGLVPRREFPELAQFGKRILSVDRVSNLAAVAAQEALRNAALTPGSPDLEAASIVFGSASGGNESVEACYQRLFDSRAAAVHPLTIPRYMASAPASHLSMLFGINGPSFAVSSACASSAHAIGEGMHLIRAGRAQIVLVGGSDASVTYGSMMAWRALQAITADTCRPFSMGRTGTVVGEGAAVLVLEEAESARLRGARTYGEIVGYGATADAAHLTKPNPRRAAEAIEAAYRDAGLTIREPVLISAHGTGTILNDASESEALHGVYGHSLRECGVIATKSVHGHMLGASGAIQLILAVLALRERRAPPVANFLGMDPLCDLPLIIEAKQIAYEMALSTSFAFGGLNCALLVRAH